MSEPTPVNIAAHLPRMARDHPDTPAVILQHGRAPGGGSRYAVCTLRELNDESDAIAHGLERIGITRGVRAVLMVKPSRAFFALTFALFKAGAVPVMIDPGMGVKKLKECLAEAQPQAFIGIPKAHVARLLLGWARATVSILVTAGPRLFWGGHTLAGITDRRAGAYTMADTRGEETAAILFTSGSTGVPKGAVYTHSIFDHQVRFIRDTYAITPGELDVATFPLFALFGPAMGMAAVVPDMDASKPAEADPAKIVEAVQKYNATSLFGSPALIKNLGRYGTAHSVALPSLKRIISAGAPADTDALRDCARMLEPGVEIYTPYGATEALPVASVGSDAILGETAAKTAQGAGTCVGEPVCPGSVYIIRITDDAIAQWSDELVLPQGIIGEIAVCSPIVTKAYYNRPESTRLAKIAGPDGAVYHRMGDVGYFDAQGRLWYCGRKAHRVETPAETLFTIPCERILNNHAKVRRTALVGVPIDGATVPVVCVELDPAQGKMDEAALIEELRLLASQHKTTRGIERFLVYPGSFPVDVRHNAKIFREQLSEWARHTIEDQGTCTRW